MNGDIESGKEHRHLAVVIVLQICESESGKQFVETITNTEARV